MLTEKSQNYECVETRLKQLLEHWGLFNLHEFPNEILPSFTIHHKQSTALQPAIAIGEPEVSHVIHKEVVIVMLLTGDLVVMSVKLVNWCQIKDAALKMNIIM